ncbi:methionine ABC transporter ATP-binding protein [Bacillus sp. Marseille-P3661]|uniref:methionine ABC transporter ATP-binding protein n=1 Tax=Bacillus sp. Marseille-P3661 TaxID=1936234 RepID=UPI000C8659F7|nr:methionine ABC transporter ATP-binding protein [Bacillus sp. Marseille-P3661]
MITLENITKTYDSGGQKVHALKNVNLTVEKGQIYGVIGFSGAGKSTLIRCVNLLERPTNGKVMIQNQDITTIPKSELRKVRQKIGMIFQHFNLLQSRTVFGNIAYPLQLAKAPKKQIQERVTELLEFVGLADKANMYPDQLSGGQKQRVGIARALATSPDILLCDEATSALDPQTTDSILKLLKQINREYGITIMMITHEMHVIREICDRVAVMEYGNVVEEGSVFDVFSQPKTQTAQNFVKTVMQDAIPSSVLSLLNNKEGGANVYKITFVGENAGSPILSEVAKKYNIDVNVLYGQITELQERPFGNLIVEFIGDQQEINKAVAYVESRASIKEVINHGG